MPNRLKTGSRVQFIGMAGDPFNLLGLPPSFDLDADLLQRRFLSRAAALHPDLAGAGSPPDEPDSADQRAAALNDARATLADPEKRAIALLALLGGPAADQDKSLPPGFLIEMMEVREQVERAVGARDPALMRTWQDWARDRRAEFIAAVAALFRDALAAKDPSHAELTQIRQHLNAWRYIERLREQLGGG